MKKFLFAGVVAVLLVGRLWAQAPIITDWASTGGTTQNKDNARDIMYLVTAGDNLTFTATVDQPVSFEWAVNKSTEDGRVVTVPATTDPFNWSMPNEKGIWEIHLRCWNSANEEVHKEWVVSTLTLAEAPDFFDYFADLKYLAGRMEKDPWERDLPVWTPYNSSYIVLDSSNGFIRRSGDDSDVPPTYGINQEISAAMTVAYGTWKFRYRFPDGNTGAGLAFSVNYAVDKNLSRQCYYGKVSDTHHHSSIYVRPESTFSIDYDGTGWPEDGRWQQVTIIRTTDTWVYMYNDNIFEFYAQDQLNLHPSQIWAVLSRSQGHQVYVDNFEVYRGKFLFPQTTVSYGKYTWNYSYNQSDGQFYPETRNGIIVKGRGIRLADIAARLGDPAKFTYDAVTKTAICYGDLVIYDNAELIMQNETLKFACNSDGERHFVLKYGAEVNLENSTITTTGSGYFIWNNAGSTTHFGRSVLQKRIDPIEFAPVGFSGAVWPLGNAGVIRFTAHNSVIDNTAHIFFDSPMELDIEDTKFTNLHELDIGNYAGVATAGQQRSRQRWFPKGDKSFWVYTDEINTNKFNLKNISFSGKTSPLNITFLINALRDKLNVYDLNLENENIVIKKSLPQQAGQSHTWKPYVTASYESSGYGGEGRGMDSKLGLVNCKFKSISVPTDLAWALPKYYLDVKVVNTAGAPISGAKVTVINEVDEVNYPAENVEQIQELFDPKPTTPNQYFYLSYRLVQGLTNYLAVTDTNGHTALLQDRKNSLVLTDFAQTQSGITNFTYAITAEKDGLTGEIKGVDPDETWYRPDPNIPTKTITVVLGVKTDARLDRSKGFVVYPNPYIKGKSPTEKITFGNLSKEATIRVYTSAGKLLAEIEHQAMADGGLAEWNVSNINSGIYLYVIITPEKTSKGKVSVIK